MTQAGSNTSTQPSIQVGSAPFTIRNVKKRDTRLKTLIYGKPGSGKTTLAASAADVPQMQGVLMINAEAGDVVLHNNERILNPQNIDIVDVNGWNKLKFIYEFLFKHCLYRDVDTPEAKAKLAALEGRIYGTDPKTITEPKKYRTVIIDSLTEIEAYCIYNLLGITGEFNMNQINDDIKTPEFKEYKQNNSMMNLIVRGFRDLDLNVIILCGRNYEQDEQKIFHYTPALTGKLSSQIQGYFDIVAYLTTGKSNDKGEIPRGLYVQPTGRYDAKNRISAFKDPYFTNPTMLTIMQGLKLLDEE